MGHEFMSLLSLFSGRWEKKAEHTHQLRNTWVSYVQPTSGFDPRFTRH
jgi:hypothetical protein